MANYWAIAIGINQYQILQPLMYAQWDAHALQSCLQQAGQFSPQRCRLLSDTSPAIAGTPTLPTREIIQQHIVDVCQNQIEAGDFLWFFFSGYGVHEGGRDYLLPIDGDPYQPIATGIPISELFATLRTSATQNILVLLDMKSFGSASAGGTQLGQYTLALAQEYHLAVMLSCQPGQFSHETLALRQGLFTAALLEGMQHYGCVTVEHLAQYLSDRLPELSAQHWRPRQDPALSIPGELRYQLILPGKGTPANGTLPTPEPGDEETTDFPPSASVPPTGSVPTPPPSAQPIPAPPADVPEHHRPVPDDDESFWRDLLKWGGLLLMLLILGVLIRNWSAFRGETDQPQPTSSTLENFRGDGMAMLEPGEMDTPENIETLASVLVFEEATPGNALQEAQRAIAAGLPLEALSWLEQVPADAQTETYTDLRAAAEQLNRQVAQTNRAILNEALASMNRVREETPVNQASDFHRALNKASRIQPGQPLYDEAQLYIQRWSYVILDLAQARAKTGDYRNAIASAQLVPPSQENAYPMAQELISQWEQKISQVSASQELIDQASRLIQPGQASTYNEAIAQLRGIQPDSSGYSDIRIQINQWSQEILQIAYNRAEAGNLYDAIEAAVLVPDDAEVYLEAREAIEGWRFQVRGN